MWGPGKVPKEVREITRYDLEMGISERCNNSIHRTSSEESPW